MNNDSHKKAKDGFYGPGNPYVIEKGITYWEAIDAIKFFDKEWSAMADYDQERLWSWACQQAKELHRG